LDYTIFGGLSLFHRRILEAKGSGEFKTYMKGQPEKENQATFDEFRPISLCHHIYKIIGNIISLRAKKIFSHTIFKEKIGFLHGRQIHDAIGVEQEVLHSIKTKKLSTMVLNLDLSKAHDRENWLHSKLMFIHIGFFIPMVNWIMENLYSISCVVLTNGFGTKTRLSIISFVFLL
jgi:hypothetical protein